MEKVSKINKMQSFVITLMLITAATAANFQLVSAVTSSTYAGTATVATNQWSNPTNAQGAPDSACSTNLGNNRIIKLTNFGFSIPSGATINGITVEVKYASSASSQ